MKLSSNLSGKVDKKSFFFFFFFFLLLYSQLFSYQLNIREIKIDICKIK